MKIIIITIILFLICNVGYAATTRTVSIYPSGASDPAGDDASYTTMSAMEAAEDGDLTSGAGTHLDVQITASDGNWNTADTTAVTFNGWTCDFASNEYIDIITLDDGARNNFTDGKYSTTAYRIEVTGATSVINILNQTTNFSAVFDGLQLQKTSTTNSIFLVDSQSVTERLDVLNCFLDQQTGANALYFIDSTGTYNIKNCIANTGSGAAGQPVWIRGIGGNYNFYNCTFDGNGNSVACFENDSTGTVVVKNCIAFNSADDWQFNQAVTTDYNSSDDGDGGDANHVDLSPGGTEADDWNDAFTDYSNGDYRVKDTGSVLYHAGLDQTSDANIPSTDIAGTTRPAGANPVSIGAFEFVATPTSIPKIRWF